MSEYTSKNNSSSNYRIGTDITNHCYRDRPVFGSSLERETENDLAKYRRDSRISFNGPMTTNFENYVHNVFRPGAKLPKLFNHSINAQRMLRIQDLLGSAALNESFDEEITKTPVEKMFDELGLTGSDNHLPYSSHYPTYNNNSISNLNVLSPFQNKDCYTSYRKKADDDWKRNNKQMIIDYKGSDITPLTPYMYAEHPYVRSQDSRIVGSNFVQITSRPKDRFLEKIERTLSEVRAMPRF